MELSPAYRWALALLVGSASNGRGDPAQSNTPQTAWVSLSNWAKDNGYKITWSKPDEEVTLGRSASTLQFTADSESAQINGIHVWLCDPITMRDGHLCLSELDVKATLQPLLFPTTNHSGHPVKTICLDPGRGGKDTGGAVGEFMEKHPVLSLCWWYLGASSQPFSCAATAICGGRASVSKPCMIYETKRSNPRNGPDRFSRCGKNYAAEPHPYRATRPTHRRHRK